MYVSSFVCHSGKILGGNKFSKDGCSVSSGSVHHHVPMEVQSLSHEEPAEQ